MSFLYDLYNVEYKQTRAALSQTNEYQVWYSMTPVNQVDDWLLVPLGIMQANSENCGPPPGNIFDLEVGQRSRSRYDVNWKG